MAKYDPLREILRERGAQRIEMRFDEIERLVGRLPASAYQFPWWWKNVPVRAEGHVQAQAWRAAGYEARADLAAQSVIFVRKYRPRPV